MEEIKLFNGDMILKSNYIKLKTAHLIEGGYNGITEDEISQQLEKVITNDPDLSIIGRLCKIDLDINVIEE